MTQAKPHSHMGPAKPIHHSRDARLRPNLMFANAIVCDPARGRACMHAIIRIRPKTGAENEVLGIGAHEPLGLKLRKGARGHMHWGPNVWMQCYFGSGEAVSHVINSTPWRFFELWMQLIQGVTGRVVLARQPTRNISLA